MTIYKPIPPEAEAAAKAAIALANKQKPASTTDTEGVPSTILDPIAVTKDNGQGHHRQGQRLQGRRHLHRRFRRTPARRQA